MGLWLWPWPGVQETWVQATDSVSLGKGPGFRSAQSGQYMCFASQNCQEDKYIKGCEAVKAWHRQGAERLQCLEASEEKPMRLPACLKLRQGFRALLNEFGGRLSHWGFN